MSGTNHPHTQGTPEYESLLNLLNKRASVRRFKPDAIPQEYIEKILEAARWAMSGANSQPWEFIVVRDANIKEELYHTYREVHSNFVFWMEQQRVPEMRHPSYQIPGSSDDQLKVAMSRRGWADAPVLIVVLGDGRKQWGTVLGAHTFGRAATILAEGLANACQNIHLAAAALGLGSEWVSIDIQDPFKRILGVPDVYTLFTIIPIGYPALGAKARYRRELSAMVHYDTYNKEKYLSHGQILDYLRDLRKKTIPIYSPSKGSD